MGDYSGSASTISGWGGTIGYGRKTTTPTAKAVHSEGDHREVDCKLRPNVQQTTRSVDQLQDQTVRLCKGHRHLPRRQWRSSYCAGERQIRVGGCGELRVGLCLLNSWDLRSSPRFPPLDQELDLKR